MFRLFTKALARQVPTVVVLTGLGLFGWWGAAHEWHLGQMFPWLPGRSAPTPKPVPEPPQNPSVSPDDVKLDSPDTTAQAGIETGEAKRQGVTHVVRATGVLAFDQTRYAHSAARVSGTAWRVFAGPGKRVVKDEVLALVAAPEAGKARADFLAAWVSHDVKAKQVERFQEAGSSIPERQIRDARELLREAKATMLNSHQALANLGLDVSLDALHGLADDKVYQRVRHLGLPSSVVGESNLSASLIPITAPLDGVVIRRDLVLGEQAGPGQTAFVLADTSKLWLLMDVRQEDIDRVGLRQPVTFRSTATGQTASGEIVWISAEVDAKTRSVRVRAEVYNPTGRHRPATFGQVEIEVGVASRVTVPDESVQWDGQSRRVFVRRDGQTFEPRLVLTGSSRNKRTELLDPRSILSAGIAGHFAGDILGTISRMAAGHELLVPVASGDIVAVQGANVLRSEMLKSRIGGD